MSFNQNTNGRAYAPGWFLAEADCARETVTVSASHAQAVTIGTNKIVPAGAVIPANGATAKGILYEDVEVTTGDMPGSIVTRGVVYEDRLPASIDSDAKTAMTGIKVKTSVPAVQRPANGAALATLTVTSVYGGASGKTTLTASGYTLGAGESYVYKAASGTAPSATFGAILGDSWTALTNGGTVSVTNDYKVTVAVIDAGGACVAAGDTTAVSST